MIWLILQIGVLAQVPSNANVFGDPGNNMGHSPTEDGDAIGEVVLRRTDFDAVGDVGEEEHVKPDVIGYAIGNWQPTNPATDL